MLRSLGKITLHHTDPNKNFLKGVSVPKWVSLFNGYPYSLPIFNTGGSVLYVDSVVVGIEETSFRRVKIRYTLLKETVPLFQ